MCVRVRVRARAFAVQPLSLKALAALERRLTKTLRAEAKVALQRAEEAAREAQKARDLEIDRAFAAHLNEVP